MPTVHHSAYICQTPGAWLARVRQALQAIHERTYSIEGAPGLPPVFDLTTWDVYRAVSLTWTEFADSSFVILVVLSGLASDDTAPARYFVDSPGWADSWTLIDNAPGTYFGDEIAALQDVMGVGHGIKSSVLEEWGRCTLNTTTQYGTDTSVVPTAHTFCRVSVYDALGEQIIDVDRCLIYNRFHGDEPGEADVGNWNGGADPGVSAPAGLGCSLDVSSVAKAVNSLVSRGMTASFDDGKTSVDLTSGDVISED